MELLPRSHALPVMAHVSFPTSSPSILTGGVSCSFGRMLNGSFDDAIVMQIVICDSHIGRNRPLSSQISPNPGILCILSFRALTEILPSIRNSAAQPGRCQLRRREAFLRLAGSYRMRSMPRQSLCCRNHREVRVVML
jgi:hypothetical protein